MLLPQIVFSATFHDPDLSVALNRSTATLHNSDLLHIIHGNGHFYQAVGDTSFLLWVSANLNKIVIRNSRKLLINWMKIRYLTLVLLLPLLSIAEFVQNFIYTEWPHRQGGCLACCGCTFESHWACTDLYYARGAQGVVPMRVGGVTNQLDLQSLMPLSVAGCGWLQLGVPNCDASVHYYK